MARCYLAEGQGPYLRQPREDRRETVMSNTIFGNALPKVAAAAVLSLAASLLLVTPAGAAPLGCGHVFSSSGAHVTLHSDIGPCPGNGLIVQADKVVIDLNGHTVRGTGVPTAKDRIGFLLDGSTGSVVRNGTVRGFDAGVVVLEGKSNTVSRVRALDNVGSGNGNFGDGILVASSKTNRLVFNDVSGNGPFDGIGVLNLTGVAPTGNTIDRNEITENAIIFNPPAGPAAAAAPSRRAGIGSMGGPVAGPDHVSGVQQDDGIRLEGGGASFNFVLNNVVRRNGLDGIALFRAIPANTHNVIENNVVGGNGFKVVPNERGGFGIVLFGSADNSINPNATVLVQNVVRGNNNDGITVGSVNNQIRSNTALGNTGFDLSDLHENCDNNLWLNNTFGTHTPACAH